MQAWHAVDFADQHGLEHAVEVQKVARRVAISSRMAHSGHMSLFAARFTRVSLRRFSLAAGTQILFLRILQMLLQLRDCVVRLSIPEGDEWRCEQLIGLSRVWQTLQLSAIKGGARCQKAFFCPAQHVVEV